MRRDIGEVLDQPHVTDVSSLHPMLETEDGLRLELWDTPGFGDSARLLKRLKTAENPLGWVLSQVWDRFTDRPFWCSQQAIKNVREEADVVLYMVNAAEDPTGAAYVEMEREVLSWIGKPVILLLNQTGPPRGWEAELRDQEGWRRHLESFQFVKKVLTLDAFARCWVQEGVLLDAIRDVLADSKRETFARLSEAWRRTNLEVFKKSMSILAGQLAEASVDREFLKQRSLGEKIKHLVFEAENIGEIFPEKRRAMASLAERLDAGIRKSMEKLIRLHGLKGEAAQEIFERLKDDYATGKKLNEAIAAVIGGFLSGAFCGLAADLAAGGLSFGGGAVVGGLLGAAGAGGLAKGVNMVRGEEKPYVRWAPEFFEGLVRSALLRYLAVAHFGRGRGDWQESEHPRIWQEEVRMEVANYSSELEEVWNRAKNRPNTGEFQAELERIVTQCVRTLLRKLWPDSSELLAA